MNQNNAGTWKKICYIFDKKQKLKAALLFLVIIVGAFVELVGVSAVLPFISAVLNPDQILETPILGDLYRVLGFVDINEYIVFLGGAIIVIYILKNIYVYVMHSMQYRFTYENQRRLSYKMMNCYMKQPYLFHLDHNSAELSRNINEDTVSFLKRFWRDCSLLRKAVSALHCFCFFFIRIYPSPWVSLHWQEDLVSFL